jgi:hypothetical protein
MIGVFNIQENLKAQLQKGHELCDLSVDENIDSIFIDWVPQSDSKFVRQAEIIEKYVRNKIPTIIFDRFLSMTYKEYIWLKRFNVFFFEPAVNNRIGFTYVPQWTEPIDNFWDNIYRENDDRSIDLFYEGNLDKKTKSFEKYFKEYASLYPDKIVGYKGIFKKTYDDYNIKSLENINLLDVKYTILLGSPTEYRIGYLPDNFFTYMQKGILPFLPVEHRFFHGMFKDAVIKDEKDISFIIDSISGRFFGVRYILIENIYDNIDKYYPEFKINHVIDKIKHYLKM